jgi:hypothetical protein
VHAVLLRASWSVLFGRGLFRATHLSIVLRSVYLGTFTNKISYVDRNSYVQGSPLWDLDHNWDHHRPWALAAEGAVEHEPSHMLINK